MKIGNSKIYFSNPSKLPLEDCNYYAVYDYNAEGVVYKGAFTKDDIIDTVTRDYQKNGVYLRCFARKTKRQRGKTGRYEVKITIKCRNMKPYIITKCIKSKYDAKYSARDYIAQGDLVTITDTKTAEIIGIWNDKEN